MFPARRWAEAFVDLAGEERASGEKLIKSFAHAALSAERAGSKRISGLSAASAMKVLIENALEKTGYKNDNKGIETAKAFIFLIIKRGHLAQIDMALEEIGRLSRERGKVLSVELEASESPSSDFLESLKKKLKENYNASDVRFDIKIKPELLTGYKIIAEGKAQDFTLAGQLDSLSRKLKA